MKFLLSILIAVFTISANATSFELESLAQYQFGHITTDGTYHISITLKGFGYLQIKKTKITGRFFSSFEGETESTSSSVKPETFALLQRRVFSLSNAKVENFFNTLTCKRMPAPGDGLENLMVAEGYSYKEQVFKGELRKILGPQGCYVSHKVFPKSPQAKLKANELAAILKVLALEHLPE